MADFAKTVLFDFMVHDNMSSPVLTMIGHWAGLNTSILKSQNLIAGLRVGIIAAGIEKAGDSLLKGAEKLAEAAQELSKAQLSMGFAGYSQSQIKDSFDYAVSLTTGKNRIQTISAPGVQKNIGELAMLFGGGAKGLGEAKDVLPAFERNVATLRMRFGMGEDEAGDEAYKMIKSRESRMSINGSIDPKLLASELNSAISADIVTNGKMNADAQSTFIQNMRSGGKGLSQDDLAAQIIYSGNFAGQKSATGFASLVQALQGNHLTAAAREAMEQYGLLNPGAMVRTGDTIGGNYSGKGSAAYGDDYSSKAHLHYGHGRGQNPYRGTFKVTDPDKLVPDWILSGPAGALRNHAGTNMSERDYLLKEVGDKFHTNLAMPTGPNVTQAQNLDWEKRTSKYFVAAGLPRMVSDYLVGMFTELGPVAKDLKLEKQIEGTDKYKYAVDNYINTKDDLDAQKQTRDSILANQGFTKSVGDAQKALSGWVNDILAQHKMLAAAVQPAMFGGGVAGKVGGTGLLGYAGFKTFGWLRGLFGKGGGAAARGGAAAAGEAGGGVAAEATAALEAAGLSSGEIAAVAGLEGAGAAADATVAGAPVGMGLGAAGLVLAGALLMFGHKKKPGDKGAGPGQNDFQNWTKEITTGWNAVDKAFDTGIKTFYAGAAQAMKDAEVSAMAAVKAPLPTSAGDQQPIILQMDGKTVGKIVMGHAANAARSSVPQGLSTHNVQISPTKRG